MRINLDLLESEHLIGKLKLLELQNTISSFRNVTENSVERRLSQALNKIPPQYHLAAMALFGSIIYVTEDMLLDSWRYLWTSFCKIHAYSLQDILLLELDRDQIRDEFYHANKLTGRLEDNLPWRSTHDIIDTLMSIKNTGGRYLESFSRIRDKKVWIMLIDMSVSGSSVISEVERTQEIIDLICEGPKPKLVVLVQVITEEALAKLRKTDFEYYYGVRVPEYCAINHKDYHLIQDQGLLLQAKELCDWFAREHVLPSKNRLSVMAETDIDIARYGFGKSGWNIVTYKNTPNNSLPLFWFKPDSGNYLPPFLRIDSRVNKSWDGRREFISKVQKDEEFKTSIQNILRIAP
jgi:hypothetical protein